MTATTRPILTRSTDIAGITNPAVLRYFETLNAGDFAAAANLFADDGVLHAPFEEPIIGKSSIATYLKTEARGMQLQPQQGVSKILEDGQVEVQVSGRVQTSAWRSSAIGSGSNERPARRSSDKRYESTANRSP